MHVPSRIRDQQENESGFVQALGVFGWALRETMDAGLGPSSQRGKVVFGT